MPTAVPPAQSTKSPSPCNCKIVPDTATIHDSTCLQEDFRDSASRLTSYNINNDLGLRCPPMQHSVKSQPILVLHSLATNVELLSRLQESAINSNYSDYICRMKESVIPFLNQTLSSICACQSEGCDPSSLPFDMSTSDLESGSDLSEYCLVNAIHTNLALLLDRVVLDRHVQTARTRECLINMDTRYQLGKIRNEIIDLEKVLRPAMASCPPPVPLSTPFPAQCNPLLTSINQILPQLSDKGHSSLALELLLVLPKIGHIFGSNNAVCMSSTTVPVMSEYCVVRFLKSYYLIAYNQLKDRLLANKITLEYIPCPLPEDMASFQEMELEGSTIATRPGFSINPPGEAIPQRPSHN